MLSVCLEMSKVSNAWGSYSCTTLKVSMELHFSHVSLLHGETCFLLMKNCILVKTRVVTDFYVFLKGKSSKSKTFKMNPDFWKICFKKNSSLSPGIRFPIRKVPPKR